MSPTPLQFVLNQLSGLLSVEALIELTKLINDAALDGNAQLTPETRAKWQARVLDVKRELGVAKEV